MTLVAPAPASELAPSTFTPDNRERPLGPEAEAFELALVLVGEFGSGHKWHSANGTRYSVSIGTYQTRGNGGASREELEGFATVKVRCRGNPGTEFQVSPYSCYPVGHKGTAKEPRLTGGSDRARELADAMKTYLWERVNASEDQTWRKRTGLMLGALANRVSANGRAA